VAEPGASETELSRAIADVADAVRELRAVTAEENLELRGRIRRLEAMLEGRAGKDAIAEPEPAS
jgi:hypothetical protein